MDLQRKRTRAGALTLVVCAALAVMTGCRKDNDPQGPPLPESYVSLYQASPNAPLLSLVVDNNDINNNPFEYTDYTGYLRFYAGKRNIKFNPFRAANSVIDTTVNLETGKAYSIFVVNSYDHIGLVFLNDNTTNPPASGKAMVRFLNLSPDTQAVSLSASEGGTPLFASQSFKAKSEFTEVDAKEYDFQIKSASGGSVLLTVPDITFQPGVYYTVLVRGYSTPPTGNNSVLSADVIVD